MLITLEKCEEYQKLYDVFGEHYEEGIAILKEILADESRREDLRKATEIVENTAHAVEFKSMQFPSDDATRYFACLGNLENMRSRYLNRGFSPEEVENMMGCFRGSLNSTMAKTGTFGYNSIYFWWTGLFITNEIFKFMGKELEIRTYANKVTWLRNKETKELKPLLMGNRIHRSGHIFGSEGCTDEEGAFTVTFEETDDAFVGNVIEKDLVQKETRTYLKSEWEVFLKPGDPAIAFHFPRNADISREGLNAFFREGLAAVKERYPEYEPKCYMCSSWLLDAKMLRFLKPTSNIRSFQEMMATCPQKSQGRSVFGYVFPPHVEDYRDLPENSSLERGLKEIYLNGEMIYGVLGIRPFDLCM